MPITHKYAINTNVSVAIWKITETESDLLDFLHLNKEEWADFNAIRVEGRRLEWLGARTALKALVKKRGIFYLCKDAYGKPYLKGADFGISMAHTQGFGIAAINLKGEAGIDIEAERQQILKISPRFLHPDERKWSNNDIVSLTKIWTAKEALYKLHGGPQLIFAEQLIINNFKNSDKIQGPIFENKKSQSYALHFRKIENLHVCCAFEAGKMHTKLNSCKEF